MMENTSRTHQELGHTSSSSDGGGNLSNMNIAPVPDGSGSVVATTAKVMKHNPGIAMDWSTVEQWMLEGGLRE